LKRTISDFLKEGILIETGHSPSKNGFTVIYRIVLACVMALEASAEPDDGAALVMAGLVTTGQLRAAGPAA
jgi:hypothetical protein